MAAGHVRVQAVGLQLVAGSAVDKENLLCELVRLRDANIGGMHIIPIYGNKEAEGRNIDFLSPNWMEMMRFSVERLRGWISALT